MNDTQLIVSHVISYIISLFSLTWMICNRSLSSVSSISGSVLRRHFSAKFSIAIKIIPKSVLCNQRKMSQIFLPYYGYASRRWLRFDGFGLCSWPFSAQFPRSCPVSFLPPSSWSRADCWRKTWICRAPTELLSSPASFLQSMNQNRTQRFRNCCDKIWHLYLVRHLQKFAE